MILDTTISKDKEELLLREVSNLSWSSLRSEREKPAKAGSAALMTAPKEEVEANTETPMKMKIKRSSRNSTLSTNTQARSGVLSPNSESALFEI